MGMNIERGNTKAFQRLKDLVGLEVEVRIDEDLVIGKLDSFHMTDGKLDFFIILGSNFAYILNFNSVLWIRVTRTEEEG